MISTNIFRIFLKINFSGSLFYKLKSSAHMIGIDSAKILWSKFCPYNYLGLNSEHGRPESWILDLDLVLDLTNLRAKMKLLIVEHKYIEISFELFPSWFFKCRTFGPIREWQNSNLLEMSRRFTESLQRIFNYEFQSLSYVQQQGVITTVLGKWLYVLETSEFIHAIQLLWTNGYISLILHWYTKIFRLHCYILSRMNWCFTPGPIIQFISITCLHKPILTFNKWLVLSSRR